METGLKEEEAKMREDRWMDGWMDGWMDDRQEGAKDKGRGAVDVYGGRGKCKHS